MNGEETMIGEVITTAIVGGYLLSGITIVRPNEKVLVETFGKYSKLLEQGFNYTWTFIQKRTTVDISEQMSDIEPQEIITKDNLNAQVDLVVFYKLKEDEQSLKSAMYKVKNVESQIQTLARTTARNVIGTMPFKEVNSERNKLNDQVFSVMAKETASWGIEITRVEMKDITPPSSVQETMNAVIKAENQKISAIDLATAQETQADGLKRSKVKEAEGQQQASILVAKGLAEAKVLEAKAQADAIKLVNESAEKYFTAKAQKLKELEVTQASLQNNSKIIFTEKGMSPTVVIGSEVVLTGAKK